MSDFSGQVEPAGIEVEMGSNTPSIAQDARMLASLYLTLTATVVRRLIGAKEVVRRSPNDPTIAVAPMLTRRDRITNA